MDTLRCAFCEEPYARAQLRRDYELDFCDLCARGEARAALLGRGHTIDAQEGARKASSSDGGYLIHFLTIRGRTRTPFSVTAEFSREGMLDKLIKLFYGEIQVGDPAFDDLVYINTDHRRETEALLRHSGAQATLIDLVRRFDFVCFKAGTFGVNKTHHSPIDFGPDGELAVCALLVHIEHIHGLRRACA